MIARNTFIKLFPDHVLDPSSPYLYGVVSTSNGPLTLVTKQGYLVAMGYSKNPDELVGPSWPRSEWKRDDALAEALWADIQARRPIKIVLLGTEFQLKVWQALLDLSSTQLMTYRDIAVIIGHPKAVRAVGNAVGANPISYLVPCHQVVRSDGGLGGYRWGIEIKRALLGRDG